MSEDTAPAEVTQPATDLVEIWTDGGCKPNPGPGGWGALLCFRGQERELSGGEAETTNNRMELTAAAEALEALKRPCRVVLHTDSEYVRNGITRWSTGWVRRKWRIPMITALLVRSIRRKSMSNRQEPRLCGQSAIWPMPKLQN